MICPACRQEMPGRDLAVWPQTRTVVRNGHAVTLPHKPFAMFHALLRARPAGLPRERLHSVLYASDSDGGPDGDNIISAHASSLRRRLAPLGIAVHATGGPGSEYHLIIEQEPA